LGERDREQKRQSEHGLHVASVVHVFQVIDVVRVVKPFGGCWAKDRREGSLVFGVMPTEMCKVREIQSESVDENEYAGDWVREAEAVIEFDFEDDKDHPRLAFFLGADLALFVPGQMLRVEEAWEYIAPNLLQVYGLELEDSVESLDTVELPNRVNRDALWIEVEEPERFLSRLRLLDRLDVGVVVEE